MEEADCGNAQESRQRPFGRVYAKPPAVFDINTQCFVLNATAHQVQYHSSLGQAVKDSMNILYGSCRAANQIGHRLRF
jgi:hypothetical protein